MENEGKEGTMNRTDKWPFPEEEWVMPKYPVPRDLVEEYSAACQIVSQYEELRSLGTVDPEKAAWAGQELATKELIERVTVLTAALKSSWDEEEPDEVLILYALRLGHDRSREWYAENDPQSLVDSINTSNRCNPGAK